MTRKSELDPLVVFRAMCEHGTELRAANSLFYSASTIRTLAYRQAAAGRYAMQFALDAGRYVFHANRARRLAGLPEVPTS